MQSKPMVHRQKDQASFFILLANEFWFKVRIPHLSKVKLALSCCGTSSGVAYGALRPDRTLSYFIPG